MTEPVVRFRAREPVVEVSHDSRVAAGLEHWVDGTFGIVRTNGSAIAMAPNGPVMSRHDLSAGGFLDGLVATHQPIDGLPPDIDHASGGPLFRDPGSGRLLVVYHGETFADGDPMKYRSFLGLAASDDEGDTFTDLGPIVTPGRGEEHPRGRPLDVGSGAAVVRDGHLWVYFIERGPREQWLKLGVARAPVDDVFGAASRGEAARFMKYHGSTFGEPGLGGSASELMHHEEQWVLWCDAATLVTEGLTLLVFSTFTGQTADGIPIHGLRGMCSRDGVRFSQPQPIGVSAPGIERFYVTIDSGGPDQRAIHDGAFDVYRVAARARYRWDDAWLERIRVEWEIDPT
jgi:hypothetical protein